MTLRLFSWRSAICEAKPTFIRRIDNDIGPPSTSRPKDSNDRKKLQDLPQTVLLILSETPDDT